MKNDPTFKFVAAILVIGVLVAFASPIHSAPAAPVLPADSAPTAPAASPTE